MKFDTKSVYVPQITTNGVFRKDMELDGSLPENSPDIARLIRINARAEEPSVTVENGKAEVKAKICFGILYESDYKSRLAHTEAEAWFTYKTDVADIEEEYYPLANVKCEMLNCKLLGPRKFVIRAKMAADISINEIKPYQTVDTESSKVNAYFMTKQFDFTSPCARFEESKTTEERANEPKAIESVVCVSCERSYPEYTVNEGRLNVKTSLNFKALCEGEDGSYFVCSHTFPCSVVAEDRDIDENKLFRISLNLSEPEARTETDDYGESKILCFGVKTDMTALCYEKNRDTVAVDAFCGDRGCECEFGKIQYNSLTEQVQRVFAFEKTYDTEKDNISSLLESDVMFDVLDVTAESNSLKVKMRMSCDFLTENENTVTGEGFEADMEEQLPVNTLSPVYTDLTVTPIEYSAAVIGNESIVIRGSQTREIRNCYQSVMVSDFFLYSVVYNEKPMYVASCKISASISFHKRCRLLYENERIIEMKSNMNTEISYIEKDGIFYPNLKTPEQTNYSIGKYGQMRLDFIKKHRRGTYTSLLVAFKLNAHLYEIDTEARRMVTQMTTQLASERGIDEGLKATDPLRWVQEMNGCRQMAEEVVLWEVVFQ